MANPIIKIKTSTTSQPPAYNESTGAGLTFGELGARVTPNLYQLFIGSTGPNPIRIGGEISVAQNLGGVNPSSTRIPPQSAIRAYVNNSISQVNASVPFVISKYANVVNFQLTVPSGPSTFNGVLTIPWDNLDFDSGSVPLQYLDQIAIDNAVGESQFYRGVFKNTQATILRVNVNYQLTWSQTGNNIEEPSNKWQRSQWIERFTLSGINRTRTGIYGFSTCLINPTLDNIDPDYDAIVNASCSFTLNPNEHFVVKAWNNGGSVTSILPSNNLISSKATLIQISGI